MNWSFNSVLPIILALTTSVVGLGNVYGVSSDGVGCTFSPQSSYTGFNVRFYDYPLLGVEDLINDFVAYQYTTRSIRTTTTGVTDPNFSLAAPALGFSNSIYGMYLNTVNVLIDYRGYFKGMLF